MGRSAAAIAKRAAKRGRTEEEQKEFDRKQDHELQAVRRQKKREAEAVQKTEKVDREAGAPESEAWQWKNDDSAARPAKKKKKQQKHGEEAESHWENFEQAPQEKLDENRRYPPTPCLATVPTAPTVSSVPSAVPALPSAVPSTLHRAPWSAPAGTRLRLLSPRSRGG